MEYNPLYDENKGSTVSFSSFHDISDVEFQDNWGRVWYEFWFGFSLGYMYDITSISNADTINLCRNRVDLGTADFFSIDVLLNCLTVLSSE